jgi:hypothetical protein
MLIDCPIGKAHPGRGQTVFQADTYPMPHHAIAPSVDTVNFQKSIYKKAMSPKADFFRGRYRICECVVRRKFGKKFRDQKWCLSGQLAVQMGI